MKTAKYNIITLCLLSSMAVLGQTRKFNKTYDTTKEVTVSIEGQHTDVQVEYWDQNKVQVEAYLTGTEEKSGEALKNWNLEVDGDKDLIQINSSGGLNYLDPAASVGRIMVKMPEIMVPLQEMISPILENISANPLPPEFFTSMSEIKFDYEAYQKEGDAYLEKFEKKIEKNLGKDFEKKMEQWAANFAMDSIEVKKHAKEMEKWAAEMEVWGEKFGKDMEKWGEQFGKEMEAMAKEMEQHKAHPGRNSSILIHRSPTGIKRTLKIKVPREAQLKLDVRHGEVKLGGITRDLRADLSHSRFTAQTISGKNTLVNVAYSPVQIEQWNYGVLKAAYIEDLSIGKVVSIKLDSNSSDIAIGELVSNGIFNGSFGALVIRKVAPGFESLDFDLENSDLTLDLPEGTAFNFTYNGNKSDIDFPEGFQLKASDSYDLKKLKGFNKSSNGKATVMIHADFSDIMIK